MKALLRILLSVALAVLPLQAWAASGATTVSVFDSNGTARTVNVYSTTGAVTGNLSWMNTICDWTTLTQCATVNSNNSMLIDANTSSQLHTDLTSPLPTATPPYGIIGGVVQQAFAAGGWSSKWFVAANSDNATNLKASAGVVHGIQIYGIDATPVWLKFYDTASSPTCGSTQVVAQYLVPVNATAANGAGNNAIVLDKQFSTGISYCVVKGIAATDDTSVDAASYVINIGYQ